MTVRTLFAGSAIALVLTLAHSASAVTLRVTITSNAPSGGVYLTPVWAGFHDGSFDTFDGGAAASAGLEAIAEDGNTSVIAKQFSSTFANGIQGVVGGAPIAPGQSVSQTFEVTGTGDNTYFSYASMVLPSSDYFVANDNPFAHSIADILNGVASQLVFNIGQPGTVYDAGTEIDDFATSAGNGLFPGLGGGQMGPNEGADENGVVTAVSGDPFAGFLGKPGIDLVALNFNDAALYANGIATVTISAVPVPAALPLLLTGLGALGFLRRRIA
jgi:hypothetical protein